MKLEGFEIVRFRLGQKMGFYSIKLSNDTISETDKFLYKFSTKKSKNFSRIIYNIDNMANKRGFLESQFEHEYGNIYKFSKGNIRLYCLLFSHVVVVLGGGGIKKVRATQQSEELTGYVKLLDIVDKEITNRIKSGDLTITDNRFKGDLNFNFENN